MARKPQVSANQLAFDLWDIPDEAPPAPKPPTTATVPESETEAPPSGGVTGSDLVEAMGERLQIITVGRQTPAPAESAGSLTRSRAPRGPVAARGEAERVRDGVAAARVLHELRTTGQPASDAQRETLARWPGWGAVPALFDESSKKFAAERDELKSMWSEDEWAAARRTTINAHYTDPAYVQAMWRMLGELGLTEGRVLEPGSGSGNFLGAAPEGIDMVGVEVDPVTAEISQHLHPHATVRAESFATTRVDGDGFDAVIGNVPFANTQLYDPAHNPQKFSIHNHFIAKSIDFTKPGGLVAVLSSRYTLDAKSPAVRQRLFETADLVGAVRLPTGAHKATAGTEVVTDLLLFRKRRYGETPGDDSWLRTTALTVGESSVDVNAYFVDHPEAVVGDPVISHGMYGANELRVMHRGADLTGDVQSAIAQLTKRAKDAGTVWDAAGQKVEYRATETRTATGEATIIGHLSFEDGEVWAEALKGRIVVEAPAKVKTELVMLLELRDQAKALLEAEGDDAAAPETLEHLRERLGETYQQYRDTYGPINRVDLVPIRGRAAGEDGDEAMRRKYPPVMQLFRNDPEAATVFALEVFDEETQRAKRADIFHKRVIGGAAAAPQVESLPDALAVVMDTEGTIDLDKIAGLLRTTADDVHTRLIEGELAFLEPPAAGQEGPQLVQRAEYLSGNVRKKLATAKLAASTDERYAGSVAALEKVIPEEFGPAEIDVRFGATWVPAKYYEQFIQDHTGASGTVAVERPGNGDWAVKMGNVPYHRANEIGTPDVSVKTLLGKVLNHGRLVVERKDSEGKSYVDVEASELLREKASNLVEAFQSWLWAEPERAAVCAEIYNDRFNAMVLRSYDDVQLSLPKKADSFTPRPHQVAAVARMINEPAVGLFHEVGAGKTAEMVMGVMELRRLKLVSKPAIVVPNHMLDQFTREFKQIYPLARVLSAGSAEVSMAKGKDARRVFVERARTGDWDAVIITRSAFSRLGLSPATEAQFLQNKISEERARLEAIAGSDLGKSRVKGQEKAILRLEEKLKEALDMPRDEGLFFEKTGIDYLCVDEAHGYKNLQVTSSYEGLSKAIGSNLALDLDMKLRYLRGLGRERVVTLATATPMANGLQELYVMQSYLRPDLLEEAGLTNADEWARQFTEEVTQAEIGPAGDYRMKTRIGKFRNLPELLTMFHVAGDVKTAKDLGLPVPLLAERADGRRAPEVVVIPHTTASLEFQKAVGERAKNIRGGMVDPSMDNMLKLSSNSRDAALDMRLFDPEWRPGEDELTKASVAAERIMHIHKAHEARPYTDALGDQHPTLGGVQLVFADRGTPSEVRFSAYRELKEQLVARGMPAERIRFIHDAATDAEKDAMFALCRSGAVSVIVGSTEKMGTGTNIQDRALALHHLDCPWRPADVIQREGRLIRQGNQNPTVQVLRYVQSGSFDAFMWQTVTRKAIAAEQIMSGKITAREIEMVSSEVFTYAEAMAMSNDDPRIIERIEMDAEIQRLKRLERGHRRERIAIGGQVSELNYKIEHMQKQIPVLEQLLAKRSDTTGDAFFGHVVNGPTAQPLHHPAPFTGRAEFGQALKNALLEHTRHAPGGSGEFRPIYSVWAGVGGVAFKVSHGVSIGTGVHMVRLSLQHPTQPYQSLDFEEVRIPVGELSEIAPHALAMRLERKVQGLVEYRAGLEQIIEDTRTEVGKLQQMQAEPFGRKGELEELTTRREQLIAAMTGEDGHPKQPGPSPHSSTPPPAPEAGPAIGR